MYKKLSLAVLVIIIGLLAGHSASSLPSSPVSPVIVKTAAFPNQTAPIPLTPLFTPNRKGLFRVSAYMTEVVPVTGGGAWFFNLAWTDDAGPEGYGGGATPVSLGSNAVGYGSNGAGSPGGMAVIEAVQGQPVNFFVSLPNATTGGTYSLYFVVEQLN
jgi:hypothetical protein